MNNLAAKVIHNEFMRQNKNRKAGAKEASRSWQQSLEYRAPLQYLYLRWQNGVRNWGKISR